MAAPGVILIEVESENLRQARLATDFRQHHENCIRRQPQRHIGMPGLLWKCLSRMPVTAIQMVQSI
jgi:hypothetical protein